MSRPTPPSQRTGPAAQRRSVVDSHREAAARLDVLPLVRRGVAERGVAHAVVLVDRLLHDVGTGIRDAREVRVEIVGGEVDAEGGALRDDGEEGLPLIVGDVGADADGCSTIAVSGCSAGPTVIHRMPA